jgi:hypothetical protein
MPLPASVASMANSATSSAPAVVITGSLSLPSAARVLPGPHRLHSPSCRPHHRFFFELCHPQDARLGARSDRTNRDEQELLRAFAEDAAVGYDRLEVDALRREVQALRAKLAAVGGVLESSSPMIGQNAP